MQFYLTCVLNATAGVFWCVCFFFKEYLHTWSFRPHQRIYFFFLFAPAGTLVTTGGGITDASSFGGGTNCAPGSSNSLLAVFLDSEDSFSTVASSCLFASAASLSAISLSEQSFNLCTADLYWPSNYTYIHIISCHTVEKQKVQLVNPSSPIYSIQKYIWLGCLYVEQN